MALSLPAPFRVAQRHIPRLLLLLATLLALVCLALLLHTGPADALPEDSPIRTASTSLTAAPIYNEPGAEALEHAERYLESIDAALSNGRDVLRSGDSEALNAQNRYFNALVTAGYAQFGSSYYDPLGSCGVAGSSARHLWHTQVRALSGVRQGNVSGEVRKAGATLQSDRQACLDSVRIALETPAHWAPLALAGTSPAPSWNPDSQ
ncbi:hypothetical protein ACLUTX_16115 [Enterobacterales bacterium AE_CKDN230030158-1A_HGKHYDSX7]